VTHSKINKSIQCCNHCICIYTVVTSPNAIQWETCSFSDLSSDACTFSKCYCDSGSVKCWIVTTKSGKKFCPSQKTNRWHRYGCLFTISFISTCFGHHYAHCQEKRLYKTRCGVSLQHRENVRC